MTRLITTALIALAIATPARAQPSVPLKPGFYVDADTPCGEASNATMLLVGRTGIWGNRERCTYRKVERKGASYRVTQRCGRTTAASSLELVGGDAFKSAALGNKRYCPQSELPEPWRNNDISKLVR